MFGLRSLLVLTALAGLSLATPPAALAADSHAAPGASPWEHPLWHNATTLMRLYVCDHARRPPGWCDEAMQPPEPVTLPEVLGPTLDPEDAKWLDFLKAAVPAELTEEELALVRRRAVERRDPQAMEILGFLYAEGLTVPRDYVEAYRWYGMAFLAGEPRVRANMDVVWALLQRHDLEGAAALAREFDALAAGEAPASLTPVAPPAPESPGGPR
ncbi:MAG TPA: SEL1-like repeat protein [Kiloniellaceae bacterium]|nr:SEL1-like repeat protein [Kiloniellaceae bacterium]